MNKFLKHPEPNESDLKGPHYWRSLDELAETDGFKAYLHREFPTRNSLALTGSLMMEASAPAIVKSTHKTTTCEGQCLRHRTLEQPPWW